MPGDSLNDEDIDAIAALGDLRSKTKASTGAAYISSEAPEWSGDVDKLLLRQRMTMGERGMKLHYAELLRTAIALEQFWYDNVGNTTDWPLIVIGESQVAIDELFKRVRAVAITSGCLTEV